MISQIFILSARGDTIINRDFRSDLIKNTPELFFRKVKMAKGDCQPVFNIEGINFAYISIASLYVVATTRFNVSPSFILQLLHKIVVTIRDFCGIIMQQTIRKNFVLVYEILDQIIDFGHPQLTNTSLIKPLIASEPIQQKQSLIDLKKFTNLSLFSGSTATGSSSLNSVIKNKGNQIYLDVIQKMNILFNASGYVINSSIDGCIQMKSYLHGNPALKLSLNQDIVVGQGYGSVVLDDCNFHETVNYSQFLMNKSLRINPPQGQFIVMNYRLISDFNAPFKLFTSFQTINPYKIQMTLKLKSTYAKSLAASTIYVKVPLPHSISGVTPQLIGNLGNQKSQYNTDKGQVQWVINKMPGQTQYTLVVKITVSQVGIINIQRQTGPIALNFQIPSFNVSGLQIKGLKVLQGQQNPAKYIRYITKSSSYVCRI